MWRTRSAARLRPRQARRSPSAVSTGQATACSASADAGPNGNNRAEGGMLPNSGWGFSADIADIVFVAHTSSRIRGLQYREIGSFSQRAHRRHHRRPGRFALGDGMRAWDSMETSPADRCLKSAPRLHVQYRVSPGCDAPAAATAHRSDPHRRARLLHRGRRHADIGEIVVLALVAEFLSGKSALDDAKRLKSPPKALVEGDTKVRSFSAAELTPTGKSTRPPGTLSRTAMSSATRTGL